MAEEREARFRALYEAARPRIVACAISCPSANACVALGVSDQGYGEHARLQLRGGEYAVDRT